MKCKKQVSTRAQGVTIKYNNALKYIFPYNLNHTFLYNLKTKCYKKIWNNVKFPGCPGNCIILKSLESLKEDFRYLSMITGVIILYKSDLFVCNNIASEHREWNFSGWCNFDKFILTMNDSDTPLDNLGNSNSKTVDDMKTRLKCCIP